METREYRDAVEMALLDVLSVMPVEEWFNGNGGLFLGLGEIFNSWIAGKGLVPPVGRDIAGGVNGINSKFIFSWLLSLQPNQELLAALRAL
ncbi:hypothetical protein WISP_126623 [Willisornis vidua]|uniref:Uncharacterized protein n=1 Tax=Willisornis vidua TaxID=1566151 RepID=A0ABQ9CVN7_9PASS|nr:hypothetical protein WISP_126623 [Willisornis vidua]